MIPIRIISKRYYHINNIDETEYSEIVWKRKEIIDKYDLLKSEGCDEKVILEVISVSRASIFRWKKKYKLYNLAGLEDESRRPNNTRKSTWTPEIENRIHKLRREYPIFGKAKLAIMYKRKYKDKISESKVGRIIANLIVKRKIYPVKFLLYKRITQPRKFTGHSKRWNRDMKATKPGELVQFDHMTIQLVGHGQIKHFSDICQTTKIAVEYFYKEANSRNGAHFLNLAISKFPFPILSIQVDGGGEFMKDFENLCEKLKIPLFVLPPRSPEFNCNVERGNGTFKYEFYAQHDSSGSLDKLHKDLQKFVEFYNKIRPHHGLGLLTPYEFYELIIRNEGPQSHMY